MSVSILYHCSGLVKVKYLKTEFHQDKVIFRVWLRDSICSRCQSYRVAQEAKKYSIILTVPIDLKLAFLNLEDRRFHCMDIELAKVWIAVQLTRNLTIDCAPQEALQREVAPICLLLKPFQDRE